jgi:hypothetical protein
LRRLGWHFTMEGGFWLAIRSTKIVPKRLSFSFPLVGKGQQCASRRRVHLKVHHGRINTIFGFCDEAVHLEVHPTIPRLSPPPPRTLWIGFGDLFGHTKPCFNCLLPVQSRQGPPCGLKPLTRLNWRALFRGGGRLFGAVKGSNGA